MATSTVAQPRSTDARPSGVLAPAGVAAATFGLAVAVSFGLLGGHRQFNVDHDFVYGSARACGLGESCALVGPWNTIGFHLGPGFVYFLSPFLGVSPDPWAPFATLLVLSAVAAASLAWVCTARFGVGAGLGAGLFAATNPSGLRILSTGLSSALGPLVVASIALLSLRWTEEPRRRTLVVVCALVGVGMQCHSLVALLFLVPLGLRVVSRRGSVVGPSLLGACIIVALHVPWLVHYGRVGFPDLRHLGVSRTGERMPDPLLLGALVVAGAAALRRPRGVDGTARVVGVGVAPFALVATMGIALGAWQPYYALIGLPFLTMGIGRALAPEGPLALRVAAALCVAGAVSAVPMSVLRGSPGAPRVGLDAQLEIVEHLAGHGWEGRRLSTTVHGAAWNLDEMAPVYLEAWKLGARGSDARPAAGEGGPSRRSLHALVEEDCAGPAAGFSVASYRISREGRPLSLEIYESRLGPIQMEVRTPRARCESVWPGPPVHPQIIGHMLPVLATARSLAVPTSLWPERFSGPVLADLRAQAAASWCDGQPPGELVLRTAYRRGADDRALVVRTGTEARAWATVGARRHQPGAGTPLSGNGRTQLWTFPLDAKDDTTAVEVTVAPEEGRPPTRAELLDVYEVPARRCRDLPGGGRPDPGAR